MSIIISPLGWVPLCFLCTTGYLKDAVRKPWKPCLFRQKQPQSFLPLLGGHGFSTAHTLVALYCTYSSVSVFLALGKVFKFISLVRKRLMSNAVSAHNSLRGKKTGCQNHLSMISSRQYNKGKQPLNTTWKAWVGRDSFLSFFWTISGRIAKHWNRLSKKALESPI